MAVPALTVVSSTINGIMNLKLTADSNPNLAQAQLPTGGATAAAQIVQGTVVDTKIDAELKKRIEKLTEQYNEYVAKQKNFVAPLATISFDDTTDPNHIEVHMDVEYNNTKLHFESVKVKHTKELHDNLLSQKTVLSKFADGDVYTEQESIDRIKTLSGRFDAHNPYSGFRVTDAETDMLIGMTVIGVGSVELGHAEMARINRTLTWSHSANSGSSKKSYSGVGTAEVCAMLQYAELLKKKGYKVDGKSDLTAAVATARVDNEGSWKSNGKAGMQLVKIDSNPDYGPELRYHLKKPL